MLLSYPLMAAIQEISARVGRVTGCGISANLRRHYPRCLLHGAVTLVLAANIYNLGADIGAMGASAQLLLPARTWVYTLLFGIVSLLLQILVPYSTYVKYLKWLTLSLFAYVATAFFVRISWSEVLLATVLPRLSWSKDYLTGLIAVMGTTISPYLFFWQASQETEEVKKNRGEKALKHAPRQAPDQLERIRTDTYVGMALSNLVAFFIILTSAATLHARGHKEVATAAQAAQALAPLAGRWAAGLFVCGIIGTGLLAIPVLAGSAAYAMGESFKWPVSLEKKPEQAPGFYVTIARGHTGRRWPQFPPHRPDSSSVLGRGPKRHSGCAPDGGYHAHGGKHSSNGQVHDTSVPAGYGMGRNGSHVWRICRSIRDMEIAWIMHEKGAHLASLGGRCKAEWGWSTVLFFDRKQAPATQKRIVACKNRLSVHEISWAALRPSEHARAA